MSVGASGVELFVFNNFEQKILEKKFHCWIYCKTFEKNFHCWFHWKKNRKKFPLLISLKKIFTSDLIENNLKNNYTADFIAKIFCDILPDISGGEKSVKFWVNLYGRIYPTTHKIFRIMVGVTLKKLSKSFRI